LLSTGIQGTAANAGKRNLIDAWRILLIIFNTIFISIFFRNETDTLSIETAVVYNMGGRIIRRGGFACDDEVSETGEKRA
jgi:hypothetical protein